MHEDNEFLTLTYNPESLPTDESISVRTFQLFMKRLRKKLQITVLNLYTGRNNQHTITPIRSYQCGEYGEDLGRPHYHVILFGYAFPDKIKCEDTQSGKPQYTSAILDEIWGLGFCTISAVTLVFHLYYL